MHIPSTLSMFLKFVDFVSHRLVENDLKHSDKVIDELFTKKTIENYFSALDIKKWRIAHTIGVYKSDGL